MPERIIDTNILLAYVRGRELYAKIEAQYALQADDTAPLVSVANEGELRALSLQFVWGEARQQEMERQLAFCTIIPLPFADVVETYAEIDDYSRRNGVTMSRHCDHLDGVYLNRNWVDPVL